MVEKQNVTEQIKLDNNIEILKKYFPNCFDKDGNFNLDKFKEEIKINEINLSTESYSLEWLGKSYARVLTFEPARTLLKADEEWNDKPENKNSGNILIKGDNLEVLKHLVNAYHEKIKMIYIDPPYNTGNDGFVYQDDRKFTVEELAELAGIDEERAKRILDFVNSKSNSHSAWLTFMYPRLYIARRLLREDGVIFVSIDDNEVAQLRILMDEIFGEENFVNSICIKSSESSGVKMTHIDKRLPKKKEYLLLYAKNKSNIVINPVKVPKDREELKEYSKYYSKIIRNPEDEPKNWEIVSLSKYFSEEQIKIETDEDLLNFKMANADRIVYRTNNPYLENLNLPNKIDKVISPEGKVYIYWEGKQMLFLKDYLEEYLCDLWTDISTINLNKEMHGIPSFFDGQKPIKLIKRLIKLFDEENLIIIDFFAGSGTTGDAVMQLNAEDGGNRRFILVQIPECIDPDKVSDQSRRKKIKALYDFVKNKLGEENPTIFHICKERLVRAAKKIKEETINKKIEEKEKEIEELKQQLPTDETKEKIKKLEQEIEALRNQDLGFKIFEAIPIWEDYLTDEKELTEQTTLFDVSKLTDEDLKALLITWKTYDGLPLTEECKEVKLNDYTAYHCGANLYLLHKNWKTDNIKALLEKIDSDKDFVVDKIIVFGYNFTSKHLREIEENIRNYSNKKQIEIETIIRF